MAINHEQLDKIRKSGLRPGIVGCFVYKQKILFVYSKEYKLWQLPQGGIDNGESIREAIFRELTEELGSFLDKQCEHEFVLFAENKVEFPKKNQGYRKLFTDDGTEVLMKGKKYFFITINAVNPDLKLKETEFDDYYWLTYAEAKDFCEKIYQKGKRRITEFALDKLYAKGVIK